MKTLDEVIKALEICIGYYCTNAEHDVCPYFGMSDMGCMKEPEKDALYYLKMYRSDMQMYAANQKLWEDELQQKIKGFGDAKDRYIARLKELDIGTLNEPLTWEQLKQMEEKPVWIELLKNGHWKGWDVIAGFNEDDFGVAMVTVQNDDYYKLDLGKTWQAYRKER